MKTKTPTRSQLKKTMDVLEAYGRNAFWQASSPVPIGMAIGHSLYTLNEPAVCVDIAIEMCEQWNMHQTVAVLRALHKGRGQVAFKCGKKTRKIVITLRA